MCHWVVSYSISRLGMAVFSWLMLATLGAMVDRGDLREDTCIVAAFVLRLACRHRSVTLKVWQLTDSIRGGELC